MHDGPPLGMSDPLAAAPPTATDHLRAARTALDAAQAELRLGKLASCAHFLDRVRIALDALGAPAREAEA